MEWMHVFVLAIIQGLTEFLPVSSSAHLILPAQLFGWPDQGLAFDVGVHVGTLIAVVFYFRKDVSSMLVAFFNSLRGQQSVDGRIAWFIIGATLPALISGYLLHDMIALYGRSILVIAGATLIFGALLWFADTVENPQKKLAELTLKESIFIGCAQALALIPGTSRSGITMTAALMAGFSRETAAKFSFYLSIPIILAAGSYKGLELASSTVLVRWDMVISGVFLSAAVAFACIHFFLIWLEKVGMLPFVIYRFVLGLALLAIYFSGSVSL
ncbi:MAG: undecaprenyl-diphosphate phosphatase [Oceanospirillaceae bacterium]|nr:undecaprenyl-diphosphate phosphatase [Oceanospirillaceae bacterium]